MMIMARTSRFRMTDDLFQRINRMPKVRAAAARTAQNVASRARALEQAEDDPAAVTVEHGIRPKGRAYSQVQSSNVDGEFGTSKTERRGNLGRAANGG